MDVSMRLESVDGKRGMSVYMSGHRVKSGLSEEEALELMASLLNSQFAEAKAS